MSDDLHDPGHGHYHPGAPYAWEVESRAAEARRRDAARAGRNTDRIPCLRCHGTGVVDAPYSGSDPSCPACDGEGMIEQNTSAASAGGRGQGGASHDAPARDCASPESTGQRSSDAPPASAPAAAAPEQRVGVGPEAGPGRAQEAQARGRDSASTPAAAVGEVMALGDEYANSQSADGVRIARAALQARIEALVGERDAWKNAIIDAAVVDWTYTQSDENDPRGCVNKLLAWQGKIALDPQVSAEARALHDRIAAADRALGEARGLLEEAYYSGLRAPISAKVMTYLRAHPQCDKHLPQGGEPAIPESQASLLTSPVATGLGSSGPGRTAPGTILTAPAGAGEAGTSHSAAIMALADEYGRASAEQVRAHNSGPVWHARDALAAEVERVCAQLAAAERELNAIGGLLTQHGYPERDSVIGSMALQVAELVHDTRATPREPAVPVAELRELTVYSRASDGTLREWVAFPDIESLIAKHTPASGEKETTA